MEPQIAALAAHRVTPELIDRLKILVCDQQCALIAGRADDHFDAEFHQQLTAIAGNQVIGQVMVTIASIVNESRSVWLQSSERRQTSVTGHLRIIDALENRDAEAACMAMKNHIAEIENHIFGESQEY
jgi:GntR family transcriptional repressor for pyruvate dehydrogenase complex